MAKILLVEDEKSMVLTLRKWLQFERHVVETAETGGEALEKLQSGSYDVVVLDIDIPAPNGIEVCKQLRAWGLPAAVLMLTGKRTVSDKTTGLDSGADDYLTKPFDVKELSARVRALLRRPVDVSEPPVRSGSLIVDAAKQSAVRDGVDLSLTPAEIALLDFLMRNSPQIFSSEALLHQIGDRKKSQSLNAVRIQINKLREKLDIDGMDSHIQSVRNVGYRFNRPVDK